MTLHVSNGAPDDAPAGAPDGALAAAGALALAAQGALLALVGDLGHGAATLWLVAVATLAALLWRRRRRLGARAALYLGVAGLGGLGMLLGAWLDGHGGHVGHGLAGLWTTVLMLAACVPACVWAGGAAHRGGWRHAGAIAGMWLGMVAGGVALTPLLVAALPPAAAMHLAMLAGMVAGTAAGLALLDAFRRRGSSDAGRAGG